MRWAYIKTVTFDCADALTVAGFWAAVLGSDLDESSTSERAYVEAPGWGGPNMWFNRVPEPKCAKNRIHFDIRVAGDLDSEVKHLISLGASIAGRGEDLVLMHDPEGNEFCVEH